MRKTLIFVAATLAAFAFTSAASAATNPVAEKLGEGVKRAFIAGFTKAENEHKAMFAVRAALPAAEAYWADNSSYAGMSIAALRVMDPTVNVDKVKVYGHGRIYCLEKTVGGRHAYIFRPGDRQVQLGVCP